MSHSTVLCICTFQRPDGLLTLLRSLPQLQDSDGLEIVVIDNDPAQAGLQALQQLPSDYPFTVHTGSTQAPGISHARNAAVDLALTRAPQWLAFLDDDEWPEPDWLRELHRVREATGADAVGGPTRSVFPETADAALRNNPYYGADLNLPDGSACQLEAAGNFLIRATLVKSLGPDYFHPAFAESGGEDLAFFTRLAALGARMHWAAGACVNETVPANRLSEHWMQERVITIANSRVRVMQMLQPGMGATLLRLAKTGALAAQTGLTGLVGLVHAPWRERARLLRWKLQGKVSAHLGHIRHRSEGH